MYERTSATLEGSDILGELADGTSGAWFHDNNDYKAGFLKVAATPEIIYILGFSPENLKLDGSYHKLKVSLASPKGFALQARRGYYAPKQLADPAEQSREEVKEAVFSRDQLSDVPLGSSPHVFSRFPIVKPNWMSWRGWTSGIFRTGMRPTGTAITSRLLRRSLIETVTTLPRRANS